MTNESTTETALRKFALEVLNDITDDKNKKLIIGGNLLGWIIDFARDNQLIDDVGKPTEILTREKE